MPETPTPALTTQPGRHAREAEMARSLASLNDVVSELVAGLAAGQAPSKGYAYTVVQALAAHTRALGGEPSIDVGALDGWEGQE